MSSYWENEEKIDIKQTEIAIPSTNGLSYSAGQRIDIEIPDTVKFFDGKIRRSCRL
jgi:hypothetical protein